MSTQGKPQRSRQARRRQAPAAHRRVRVSLELLLWLVVGALLVHRVTPQVRAAFGFSGGTSAAPQVVVPMLDGTQLGPDGSARPGGAGQFLGDLVSTLPAGDARFPASV
jgi:hypothetical protein